MLPHRPCCLCAGTSVTATPRMGFGFMRFWLVIVTSVIDGVHGQQIWQPKASDHLSWQYQIDGRLNTNIDVDVYDVDLHSTSKQTIQKLKNDGKKVICYFSAGTYEKWNNDWKTYFDFIPKKGAYTGWHEPFAGKMVEWPGERWLNIKRMDLLKPIMTSRIRKAAYKGCDAIEADNVDAWRNKRQVKKRITKWDQFKYNTWLAETAHSMGLAIGLKNCNGQLAALVPYFDFAISEECFRYNECGEYKVFTSLDKAVLGVEYEGNPAVFCPKAIQNDLSVQKKNLDLKVYRIGCEKYE